MIVHTKIKHANSGNIVFEEIRMRINVYLKQMTIKTN